MKARNAKRAQTVILVPWYRKIAASVEDSFLAMTDCCRLPESLRLYSSMALQLLIPLHHDTHNLPRHVAELLRLFAG